jgi:hypothetical protein
MTLPSDTGLQTASIVKKWLQNIGFNLDRPARSYHKQLHHILHDWMLSRGLDSYQTTYILKQLSLCVSGADKIYPSASLELKTYIGLSSMFFFYFDDQVQRHPDRILPDLQKFSSRVGFRLPASEYDDSCIALWADLVASETGKFYGPYAAGSIGKAMVDFINGNIIEGRFPGGLTDTESGSGSSSAANFLRDKAGCGEAYAQFIFSEELVPEKEYLEMYFACIPDIIRFTNRVNDIMSFYKESVIGDEENTYIMNTARVSARPPVDVLQQACDEIA